MVMVAARKRLGNQFGQCGVLDRIQRKMVWIKSEQTRRRKHGKGVEVSEGVAHGTRRSEKGWAESSQGEQRTSS